MPFTLPRLPYAPDAFGETISAETFEYHHGKHHKAYVAKVNELAPAAGLEGRKLSEVIAAAKAKGDAPLFNNAAQVWNHSFYWQCLSPEAQAPDGKLMDLIASSFGSHEALVTQLAAEGVKHFGSGWAWLVLNGDKLEITALHDADTPAVHEGMKPLLTLDVWEHAYYIDYRNARPKHLKALLAKAINWQFVAQNLDGAGVSRADQG